MSYIQKYKNIEFQVIDMVGKDIPGLEWFNNMWSQNGGFEILNDWRETPPESQVVGITRERLEEIVREVFRTHIRSSIRQGYIPLI